MLFALTTWLSDHAGHSTSRPIRLQVRVVVRLRMSEMWVKGRPIHICHRPALITDQLFASVAITRSDVRQRCFHGNRNVTQSRYSPATPTLQSGAPYNQHGCTLVQAVVMVITVVMGIRHFWTTANKKRESRMSPNSAQVIDYIGVFDLLTNFGNNL